MMTAISVIVPVYNVEKYVDECIKSILHQNFEDIEIICVNDGTTDGSLKILEKYRKKDKRLSIISQDNQGLGQARNRGLQYAKGKYVCFVDGDDMLTEGALESLYKVAQRTRVQMISYETELLYERKELEKSENKDLFYYKSKQYHGIKDGKTYFIEMVENNDYCNAAWLLFLNREWLIKQKIWFYPGIYYEDVLFCLKCFWAAERVIHLNRKNYIYRIREHSIMTSRPKYINVYSSIVNYREAMKILLGIDENQIKLRVALAKHIKFMGTRIRNLDRGCEVSDVFDILDPVDDLLESCFEVGNKRPYVNERILLAGLEKIVQDSNGVVLYGAGKVGKMVQRYLCEKKLGNKIICFAESVSSNEEKEINGIPVKDVEDVVNLECLILLTVNKNYQKEMEAILLNLRISYYEKIDRYMQQALERYFKT